MILHRHYKSRKAFKCVRALANAINLEVFIAENDNIIYNLNSKRMISYQKSDDNGRFRG